MHEQILIILEYIYIVECLNLVSEQMHFCELGRYITLTLLTIFNKSNTSSLPMIPLLYNNLLKFIPPNYSYISFDQKKYFSSNF